MRKGVVSFSSGYTPDKYYNKFVLTYLQNEHISLGSSLVQYRTLSKNPFVTKKDLKAEEEYSYSREFLLEFTQDHPEIFEAFKDRAKDEYEDTGTNDIRPCDIPLLVETLVSSLRSINPGAEDATKYHRLVTGILELIFFPDLICPGIEKEINEGRKRIDIYFQNAARENFFYDLNAIKNIPCPYIIIECKNYSSDPANSELDQLIGRFSKTTRGVFGLLLCRQIKKMDLFIKRCKDTLKDDHGLIIPLTDDDLIVILEDIAKTMKGSIVESKIVYNILNERCNKIFMG